MDVTGMRSKKIHHKGGCSDVQFVKPSGGMVDVVLRHRCTLEAVCCFNAELEQVQRSAMEEIMWRPVLKYMPFVKDRHLTKSFKVGSIEVYFTVYVVALPTGPPTAGKQVTFEQGKGACEVEDVIKATMDDHLSRQRSRRCTTHLDVKLYRNYVSVTVELCKQNNTPRMLGLFRKSYSLLVLSGLLFPRSVGGVVWELIGKTEDLKGIGEYNWSTTIWSFLVEAIEDMKQKIPLKKNLQIPSFTMVWFHEHTNLYAPVDETCMPQIASWVNLYIGRKYDAAVLISSVKDNQMRFNLSSYIALRLVKEVYVATKKKVEYMTALVLAKGDGVRVHKGSVLPSRGEGSRESHDTSARVADSEDRYNVCCVPRKGSLRTDAGNGGYENPFQSEQTVIFSADSRDGHIKVTTHVSEEPKVQERGSCIPERDTVSIGTQPVLPVGPEGEEQGPTLGEAEPMGTTTMRDSNGAQLWNIEEVTLIVGGVPHATQDMADKAVEGTVVASQGGNDGVVVIEPDMDGCNPAQDYAEVLATAYP
ncbi:hypothetical protein Cgig2_006341 [Carnegiea gigantea]|uniref:Aminotransferase-like plant mobile domain-containing protein n=1 Tax=Carnegiea gigantea TaxID=171969 RepID=A0A9Q1GIX6_9CARY|nr:hypothetical protein Cgig2_006341 [Carnegiea gigantea]